LKRMLYTVVMEYRGGTYVSQVQAQDVDGALHSWAAALDVLGIAEFDERGKADLIKEIETQFLNGVGPVPLRGLASAWCTSASISGSWMLINLIATLVQTPVADSLP